MKHEYKAALCHVLWIGGGTDAGKSTVAKAIVERYALQSYNLIAMQRGKPSVRHETRDPALATENIIARDLLVTEHVRQEAAKRGLRLLEIDGTQTVEEVITIVEQHFEPFLHR